MELKVYKPYANRDGDVFIYHKGDEDLMLDDEDEIYLKDEADAAIAELKQKLEDAKDTAYAESVDAGMRERRLKRALYKALANWAFLAQLERGESVENCVKWEKVERKCRAKAEEYK